MKKQLIELNIQLQKSKASETFDILFVCHHDSKSISIDSLFYVSKTIRVNINKI